MAVFNQAPFVKNRPLGRKDAQGEIIPTTFTDTTFRAEYSGNDMIYAGFARPGASESATVWKIFKMAYDGSSNLLSIKWPQDSASVPNNEYEFSWTNRATYTYA